MGSTFGNLVQELMVGFAMGTVEPLMLLSIVPLAQVPALGIEPLFLEKYYEDHRLQSWRPSIVPFLCSEQKR
jgi:hypothetical protein